MSFTIEHPVSWIGIPERWPYPRPDGSEFSTPEQWLDALLDELTEGAGLSAAERPAVAEVLTMALQQSRASGARVFAMFASWQGPVYLAEASVRDRAELGVRSLEEFLGADDDTQLGIPFAEEFVTESGLVGARCYRYLPLDEQGVLYGRADYGFLADDAVLTLTTAQMDLVDFERVKAHLEELGASVRAAS